MRERVWTGSIPTRRTTERSRRPIQKPLLRHCVYVNTEQLIWMICAVPFVWLTMVRRHLEFKGRVFWFEIYSNYDQRSFPRAVDFRDKVAHGSCQHLFHEHCLVQWLQRHASCPCCRQSILKVQPPPKRENSHGDLHHPFPPSRWVAFSDTATGDFRFMF